MATFAAAAVQAVNELPTDEAVYAFWAANLESFAALPRPANTADDPVRAIGSALKGRVQAWRAAPDATADA